MQGAKQTHQTEDWMGPQRSPRIRPIVVTSKPAIEKVSQDIEFDGGSTLLRIRSNVLNEEKKKQVIALGQLGWSLRQIGVPVELERKVTLSRNPSIMNEMQVGFRPGMLQIEQVP